MWKPTRCGLWCCAGIQIIGRRASRRSAAELREAATHYERAAALCPAPTVKAALANNAARCRSEAEAM